ncbi:glycosyltransferase family 32 protein [Rickenella mellea]|uniref:Glycosyltransferase family 32 protein n=1 Tax=Rickenella mellea TaxID=50990 RepID=A0A4Y7QD92_9AGAM|nr:glycosyltransferase family 32 protein [Rickenella mellea]
MYSSNGPRQRSPSPHNNGSPSRTTKKRKRSLQFQAKYSSFWRPRTCQWWTYRLQKTLHLLLLLALVILVMLGVTWIWEPHIEVTFYARRWVQREVHALAPLAGCFNPSRISPLYNLTEVRAAKRHEVQAGLPLRLGMDCYDFAATIQPQPRHAPLPGDPPRQRTNFHTYWRHDLVPFGVRQEWMLKSFFATQDLGATRLILWSTGDLRSNDMVKRWLRKFPDAFQLRIVDVEALARGTALEGSALLSSMDNKAWVDGDLIRLLVMWAFGGVWVDMDSLLTRDLSPLLEHEFVTQWDCYDKIYQPFNGAVMHFLQHSPYLCEAFEIMSRSPPARSGTTEWGSLLYLKLWRRLVAAAIPPFKVLPFCFTDARSCRLDNRLPDPFAKDRGTWAAGLGMQEGGALDQALNKIFSVHLHNQWSKAFPRNGWVERLLLRRYERALGIEAPHWDREENVFQREGK